MRGRRIAWLTLLLLASCREPPEPGAELPPSRLEYASPPAGESHPLERGFTQRPSPDTVGLPPAPEPLLSAEERAALESTERSASEKDRERGQKELLSWIETYEETASSLGPRDRAALVARIRVAAAEAARLGLVDYRSAEDFYRSFIYPNDAKEAMRRYRGDVVVLTGAIAPHNMLDLADGFKLFEETPYVQEPALLATDFELSFVRCHLALPELQKLADWQEVHLIGVVEQKGRGDVILRRSIVISPLLENRKVSTDETPGGVGL